MAVRRLVSESFPTRKTVRVQWRRVCDAQLHPDARNNDPWSDRWQCVSQQARAAEESEMVRGRGRHRFSQAMADRAAGHLPRREAHLDAELGVVQRRLVFSVDGGVLYAD